MGNNIYENKSVNALILYFSLPAVVSLMVEIMASVVDTAFAGHLGYRSVDALTAMGLINPLLNLFTAFQALFAVSTAIFIAKHLNQPQERSEYFFTGILMTLLVSSTLSLCSFFALDEILKLLRAKETVLILARSYLRIQLISNLFSAMGYTLTSCIRAFGYPKAEMFLTGSAVGINIIFNAIFAFGFDLGFEGLAYGTLASEIFCAGGAWLWLHKHQLLPPCPCITFQRVRRCAFELSKLGIAQTIIQALGSTTTFFVNHMLMQSAINNFVAVWNVVQTIYTLLLMPIVGITQGVQTILAYFSGQTREKEKRKALRSTIASTVVYGLLASVLVSFLGEYLLAAFVDSPDLLKTSEGVLKIVFLTFPLMGIFYTIVTMLEVTGYEFKAVGLILTRQMFLMIPLVYILPIVLPNLPIAVFLSVPISDLLALSLSAAFARKISTERR